MDSKVIIVEYNPFWPELFVEESARISDALTGLARKIEHIGSTAVPGLGAKAIVDIMVGVGTLEDANQCIAPVVTMGYEYVAVFESAFPRRRFFRKYPDRAQHFHIHLVELGSDFWTRHLWFRDFLCAHPETAHEYFLLKKQLAEKFAADRDGYTDAKSSFIEAIMKGLLPK